MSNGVYGGSAILTPMVAGTYTYALTCGGTESGFATLQVGAVLAVTTPTLAAGTVDSVYSQTITESGGTAPYTTSIVSGALPAGLNLAPATGVISGQPTQFGMTSFAVQVKDSATPPETATASLALTIKSGLAVTTVVLPKGVMGSMYKQTLAATGGIAPYTWSVTAGALPDGITLTPAGVLTGTPTKVQQTTVTFQVADAEATKATMTTTLALNVVLPQAIGAVEFTQGIQQFQILDDLEDSLKANGEPPVPLIAGKPAVMRVYFSPVTEATAVTLQVQGAVTEMKPLTLQPGCELKDQRTHAKNCPSVDVYFTPTTASTADLALTLLDATGKTLQEESLSSQVRQTDTLKLKALQACSSTTDPDSCGSPAALLHVTNALRALMPTSKVIVQVLPGEVVENLSTTFNGDTSKWTDALLEDVGKLYQPADAAADSKNLARTDYFGVYPGDVSETAVAYVGGHAGIIADSELFLKTVSTEQILAHETGHTLGLDHTNLSAPLSASGLPPGCWGLAATPMTDWPYMTNEVQSSNGVETGFNVAKHAVVGNNPYEVMSYCIPAWISPINY